VLHVLFIKVQRMGELQRMSHDTDSVYCMKRTDISPHKLLLLFNGSYSERDTKKTISALEYPNIPTVILLVLRCEGLHIPETHFRNFFHGL
jgi:hypothetical protein